MVIEKVITIIRVWVFSSELARKQEKDLAGFRVEGWGGFFCDKESNSDDWVWGFQL